MERDAAQLAQLSKDAERLAANLHYYHDLLGETERHCFELSAWVSRQIATGIAASDLSSEESELAEYRKSANAIGNDFDLNWQELPAIHNAAKDLLPGYEPKDFPLLHLVRRESGNQAISVDGLVTELESISNNAHREAVKLLRPNKLIKELAAAAIDCRNAASNFIAHAQAKIEDIEQSQSRPTYNSESDITASAKEFRDWVCNEVTNRIEPAAKKLLAQTQGIGKPLDLVRNASTGRFIVGRNSATTACEASLLWCEFVRDGHRRVSMKVLGGNDLDYLTEAKRLIADANIPDIRSAIEAEEQSALNAIEPKESPPAAINTDELAEKLFERLTARLPAIVVQNEGALSTAQDETETANPPANQLQAEQPQFKSNTDITGDTTQDDYLTPTDATILHTLLLQNARSSDGRMKLCEIILKAFGRGVDPDSYKEQASQLVKRKYLESKASRYGGYWLTPSGVKRAETYAETLKGPTP